MTRRSRCRDIHCFSIRREHRIGGLYISGKSTEVQIDRIPFIIADRDSQTARLGGIINISHRYGHCISTGSSKSMHRIVFSRCRTITKIPTYRFHFTSHEIHIVISKGRRLPHNQFRTSKNRIDQSGSSRSFHRNRIACRINTDYIKCIFLIVSQTIDDVFFQ